MLYPVPPEKLASLVAILSAASDAAEIPRPRVRPPQDRKAALAEIARRLPGHVVLADVDGHLAIRFADRVLVVVDVRWPSPLRTAGGDSLLSTDAPVGPSRLAMWAVLSLLAE